MFDCVLPTRNGRHGAVFTRFGQINLDNARHATIRARSTSRAATQPRATIRAPICIIWCGRMKCSARMLLSAINLAYYQDLMAGMRDAIVHGRFAEFRAQMREGWEQGDLPPL